ncbi:MAG: hypothetical protein GTN49_03705 [candidate division Zixibacteria bacterium]|nr:hypothetical protein [candidate division Zixibacteria bacterium]
MPDRIVFNLNWDELVNNVKKYNREQEAYLKGEFELRELLNEGLDQVNLYNFLDKLNKFWDARVTKKNLDLNKIAEYTSRNLKDFNPDIWKTVPRCPYKGICPAVVARGEKLLRSFLEAPSISKRYLVFYTKILYWFSGGLLPIIDRRTGRAINAIKRDKFIRFPGDFLPKNKNKNEYYVKSYKNFIDFYDETLKQLSHRSHNTLVEVDRETQPEKYRLQNPILRIIDKILWEKGTRPKSLTA